MQIRLLNANKKEREVYFPSLSFYKKNLPELLLIARVLWIFWPCGY